MSRQDSLYEEANATYGAALARLAKAYEVAPDRQSDLLQDIHLALWQSFAGFDGRCSLRTWVYRVAHNVATSQVIRRRAKSVPLVDLEGVDISANLEERERAMDRQKRIDRLFALIQALKPMDRQVIVQYLEGMDAASIGEITGLSRSNVATKIHRIKHLLTKHFKEGHHV